MSPKLVELKLNSCGLGLEILKQYRYLIWVVSAATHIGQSLSTINIVHVNIKLYIKTRETVTN